MRVEAGPELVQPPLTALLEFLQRLEVVGPDGAVVEIVGRVVNHRRVAIAEEDVGPWAMGELVRMRFLSGSSWPGPTSSNSSSSLVSRSVTVTRLPNGKYLAAYEVVNRPSQSLNTAVNTLANFFVAFSF